MTFDAIDTKLLKLLQIDAKQTTKELSGKLNLSVTAVWKQFLGYGIGFLESYIKIIILKQKPEVAFPNLFFKV